MSGPMQTPPGFNGGNPNANNFGPRPASPYPQPQFAPGQMPPRGYPQQFAPGQMPPPGYPQYAPPGYYPPPPQKSGFPVWAIVVIVGVIGFFVLSILALAAIPLIATNTTEARSSEARAALGAMKDRARVVYQRTGVRNVDKASLGIGPTELQGTYFTDADYSVTSGNPWSWSAQCRGVYSKAPYDLIITADLIKGDARFNR